jgi:replicative DNA helicase
VTKDYLISQLDVEVYYRNHLQLQKKGKEHVAKCFMHDDTRPSLAVNLDNGLWNCPVCNVGGSVFDLHMKKYGVDFKTAMQEIAEEQYITMEEPKVVASYQYTNRDGHHLYDKLRYEPGRNGGKKSFCFKSVAGLERMHDPVFYNLPAIIKSKWVIIVEGEKCADKLIEWGLPATTLDSGSSSKWYDSYTELLQDKQVVILPDNDIAGKEYAERVAANLKKVKIVELNVPVKGDIIDWSGDKQELLKIIKDTPLWSPVRPYVPIRSLVVEAVHEMLYGDPASRGVLTGLSDIDELGGCFRRQDLIVIAGRPSMGKTALGVTIMRNMAKTKNPVLMFSLEMSAQQLTERLLCQEQDACMHDINRRYNHEENCLKITKSAQAIADLPIWIDETGGIFIEQMAKRIPQAIEEQGIKCVFVDYLQLMQADGANPEKRVAYIGHITRNLKRLAKENNIPIVLLAQLSRKTEERQEKRPSLADLRDSGEIEQDADMVILLYRDEYYNKDSKDAGIAEAIVAKYRNGKTGTARLAFIEESMRFANLSNWNEYDD